MKACLEQHSEKGLGHQLRVLAFKQVFLAISVFLGDGLYHFTKIAIISLWSIKKSMDKKDDKLPVADLPSSPATPDKVSPQAFAQTFCSADFTFHSFIAQSDQAFKIFWQTTCRMHDKCLKGYAQHMQISGSKNCLPHSSQACKEQATVANSGLVCS